MGLSRFTTASAHRCSPCLASGLYDSALRVEEIQITHLSHPVYQLLGGKWLVPIENRVLALRDPLWPDPAQPFLIACSSDTLGNQVA